MGGGSSSTTRKQVTETYTAAAPGSVSAREVGGNIYSQSGGVGGDINVSGDVGLTGQQFESVANQISANIRDTIGTTRSQLSAATDQSRAASSAVQTAARASIGSGGDGIDSTTIAIGVAGIGALALLYMARK